MQNNVQDLRSLYLAKAKLNWLSMNNPEKMAEMHIVLVVVVLEKHLPILLVICGQNERYICIPVIFLEITSQPNKFSICRYYD